MIRHEDPHNTPLQVRGYLTDALALVDELGPDDDLRVAVFTKAVELLAAKQIILDPTSGIPDLRPGFRNG